MTASNSADGEFTLGARITVNETAGPHLAGKHGIVVGSGRYGNSVRITLDGYKSSITLHKKYLSFEEAS